MTHDEALQEIGVAPGSSLEEIRRAYLVIFGGGLALLLALWFWVTSLQKANAPSTEPQAVYPSINVVVYESARQGLAELCLVGNSKPNSFCSLAEATVKAAEQHKCTDARTYRRRLDGFFVKGAGSYKETGTQKLDSFKEKIDEEIERCWKFWNP